MTTTFAERLQEGVGFAEKLVHDAREALPQGAVDQIDARMDRVVRRARRGIERASDVRDEARIAIKRHPFAATALAFGVGALIGVGVGRLAGICARETAPTAGTGEVDVEC